MARLFTQCKKPGAFIAKDLVCFSDHAKHIDGSIDVPARPSILSN